MNHEVTTEVLQAFADAWNRHDVDALMSFMTEDCVFEASAGPDVCGTRMQAVRRCELPSRGPATFPEALGQRAPLRLCVARRLGVDVHGNTGRRHSRRSPWVRSVHLSRWQDFLEELIPQEPSDSRNHEA